MESFPLANDQTQSEGRPKETVEGLVALWPVFLFFLVGFLLLISLIKLALTQFSIQVTVLSNAVIGALLAAKAALLLDETSLARRLEHYRRIVAVGARMLFYGVTCLLLLYAERP